MSKIIMLNVSTHSILHLVASAKLGFIILDRDKGPRHWNVSFLSIFKSLLESAHGHNDVGENKRCKLECCSNYYVHGQLKSIEEIEK